MTLDADTQALVARGDALWAHGRHDDAIACYGAAAGQAPDHGLLAFGLGTAMLSRDRVGEAVAALARAAALVPDHADIHVAHGRALHRAQRLPEALAAYDRAVDRDPSHARAQFERALVLLALGDFARGWPAYEWRLKLHAPAGAEVAFTWPGRIGPPMMPWRGEPIAGRTLLVHGEQGHGDILQFVRYLPMLAAAGARAVVKVWPALARLLATQPGLGIVVGGFEDLPPIDAYVPMMSLPGLFGTTLDRIPAVTPYIRADPAAVARWAQRLDTAAPGWRAGIAWAGDPRPDDPDRAAVDRRRSIALAELAPLLRRPGPSWVSLQVGAAAAEAAGHPILDLSLDLADFAETAAVIANLDLVIAVDTAVVHLAGAMGKPVWMLSRFDGCWRWLQGRDDSPWYPSLRIYRQDRPGDWAAVVARVAADLGALPAAAGRV